MEFKVAFGTRKVARATGGFTKHEGPVVTVEGAPEKGKNRRMLFNKTSMDLMKLEEGENQEVVFVFIDSDENGKRRLLAANATGGDPEAFLTYTTSKNKSSFHDSKEKGKSITSKPLMEEVSSFLEIDSTIESEYNVVPYNAPEGFPDTGLALFELVNIAGGSLANEVPVEEIAAEKVVINDEAGQFTTQGDAGEVNPIVVNEQEGVVVEAPNGELHYGEVPPTESPENEIESFGSAEHESDAVKDRF